MSGANEQGGRYVISGDDRVLLRVASTVLWMWSLNFLIEALVGYECIRLKELGDEPMSLLSKFSRVFSSAAYVLGGHTLWTMGKKIDRQPPQLPTNRSPL